MFGHVLQALIQSGPLDWWLVASLLLVMVVWLLVRFADRLAIAVERWMLACDRRAARKAALGAKTDQERGNALAVLDRLQQHSPHDQPVNATTGKSASLSKATRHSAE